MLIRARRELAGPALDMTPIIDMVFLLLIFFLVATTFQQDERELNVALPVAKAAGPISANLRALVVNVDAAGEIVVSGRRVQPDDLRAIVREAVAGNPQQKVTIRGDRRSRYESVVRVLDICKGSGIQQPYLDTVIE
ncbi:MAG: ExbD/TolR family protein [Phycisphaerae bacterium]